MSAPACGEASSLDDPDRHESEMSAPVTSLWWPEDRVKTTLLPEYVFGQLPSEVLHRLVAPLPWGEGLTSESYLDWIIAKAGRLFLILVDIGIPDRIFALIDESLDDSDLPFSAPSVKRLPLSAESPNPDLDHKFFLAQWRFIVRGITAGDHVKYTPNEGVPVELLRTGTSLVREGVEKVVLAGAPCRVLLRTQVTVGGAPHFFEEDEVLEEIRSLRRLAHDHVYSIYASYFVDNTVCILFSGVYERTLMSFLTDVPQPFKRLPKNKRREILVNWPHCLANGLSWLHAHSHAHSVIRPSNILVDADFRVYLGQFEALDTLLSPAKLDDIESYQYGAPERWVRSVSVQDTNVSRPTISLPSGGRSARKQSASSSTRPSFLNLSRLRNCLPSDRATESPRAESVTSQGTAIRIGLRGSSSRVSFTQSSSSGSSTGSVRKRAIGSIKRPMFYTPSITSSHSSGSSSAASAIYHPIGYPIIGTNAAIVQTWQTRQTDPEASDIFSLGAVMLDIFTFLCKRKLSAFAHHRGAKNRTAGRGGGVADCSFHLDRNAGQVCSWITLLDNDAKKHKDSIFQAVRPMLDVIRVMLSRDPVDRPSAFQVEQVFARALQKLDHAAPLHCTSKLQHPAPRPKNALRIGPNKNADAASHNLIVPRAGPTAAPRPPSSLVSSSPSTEYITSNPGGPVSPMSYHPSTAASASSSSLPDCYLTDSYVTGGSDTDPEQDRYMNPWLDPDYVSEPTMHHDPFWNYSIALGKH
ncbi:protein kinase domain-containing protein [Aspergillus homomorphus CBS 101889]|uniref:Protein kinase domain-containing protein n=1 Tax=Aspergillus homomorphus (strain CBS 101889) TaxID=1450537 RepID=A0A395HIH7_ASPHC|nr:hypothetical protein BO97DRAFT_243574 [Aspergillus homomorphus CBS 101889]RAL07711.1 hypothetical protein BO97DRAFT_243574 [Aspergillus homomorphus CBS 101889]